MEAGEANALLVLGGGLSGVGVVRQRDPEHGDRKGQRHSHAVGRRMVYVIRRRLTPVDRQTLGTVGEESSLTRYDAVCIGKKLPQFRSS